MPITLPVVTDDFEGQCNALDAAILEAAQDWQFQFVADVPKYQQDAVPELIYQLIRHYTGRGFHCEYDGELGKFEIDWSHPNMTWSEHRSITRSSPSMIPMLGIGYSAAILYLCMTNGIDMRKHSDMTLLRTIERATAEAATAGNLKISFGFDGVPAPAIQTLFAVTFQTLEDSGYVVTYSSVEHVYHIRWGQTLSLSFTSGERSSAFIGQPTE